MSAKIDLDLANARLSLWKAENARCLASEDEEGVLVSRTEIDALNEVIWNSTKKVGDVPWPGLGI